MLRMIGKDATMHKRCLAVKIRKISAEHLNTIGKLIMTENYEEIKKACLEKWQDEFEIDKRLQYFCNSFHDWLEQIPESAKHIALTLIQNLEYYSRPVANRWLHHLHSELTSRSHVTDENTIYAFIKSEDGKSNSSNDYWTEYKAINEVNAEICYENTNAISTEEWEYIENIVFIDDFSGSGSSFIDELSKDSSKYKRKNVYFIAINIMRIAISEIKRFGEQENINIVMLIGSYQEKAFERNLFENDDDAKNMIKKMSKQLKIPKNDRLGWKKCQSLVAFYNNTPNNTLGFIRYDTDTYRSLFPRRNDKKPAWQTMKRDLEKRKMANYNNQIRGST